MQEECYLKAMESNLVIIYSLDQTKKAKREALQRLKECQAKIEELTRLPDDTQAK